MAINPRVLGNSSRFSISRPGVNVRTAPRTSDYMAVDTALPVERFLAAGIVLNRNTLNFGNISLAGIIGTNVPCPQLEVLPVDVGGNPSTLSRMLIQFAPSGVVTQFAPWRWKVVTTGAGAPFFNVFDPYNGSAATDYNSNNRNWIWMLLKAPP